MQKKKNWWEKPRNKPHAHKVKLLLKISKKILGNNIFIKLYVHNKSLYNDIFKQLKNYNSFLPIFYQLSDFSKNRIWRNIFYIKNGNYEEWSINWQKYWDKLSWNNLSKLNDKEIIELFDELYIVFLKIKFND